VNPLEYLFRLDQFGIKFGLENISRLVERLGHPERAFRSVHVAGTNGKGSVTAMIDAALRAAGHRSARYTSPHLLDITERFVVDGRPVERADLMAVLGDIREAIAALQAEGALDVHPTFFEVTTAAAFDLFRRAAVETAVLEVGLGGRLDATNVVLPEVTAITSIALDHQKYLGSTLTEIAREKAGIIKPGVPVVVGTMPRDAAAAIEAIALEKGAAIVRATRDDVAGLVVGLPGAHQRHNAAVAARVLQTLDARGVCVPAAAVAEGLAHPDWPGRLDLRRLPDGREALLDAAHNPAGADALASYLREWHPDESPPPLVFAAMRDKDVESMFTALLPVVGPLIVTRASTARGAVADELAAVAQRVAPQTQIVLTRSPADALAAAWQFGPRIVVAGSIFLLGDILKSIDAA